MASESVGGGGGHWARHWLAAFGIGVLAPTGRRAAAGPDRPDPLAATLCRRLGCARQVAGSVHSALERVLGRWFCHARSAWGPLTRLAAKIAAFDIALCMYHLFHRPPFVFFKPFC